MIQRIQSIYLLLGGLIIGSFVFTRWTVQLDASWTWLFFATKVLAGLIALAGLICIFLYSNRSKQRQVVVWVQTLAVIFLLMVFLLVILSDQIPRLFQNGLNLWMLISLLGPVAAYLMFFLARRSIEKDIALIRSIDRIR